MNKEEIDKWLDNEYGVSYTRLEELHDFYFEKYCDLKEENKHLKDNWDKLREYIRETKLKEFEKSYGKRFGKTFTQAEVIVCNMILDKMKEIEQGSDSNE